MALLRRQSDYTSLDDQSPEVWGSFMGDWTRNTTTGQGFYNYTFTATQTPGASLSFRFSGSQAWIYGSRTANGTNGVTIYYPTADYTVDGVSAGSQKPSVESETGRVIYFRTPQLVDGTHEIDFTVTSADEINQFVLDYITIIPSSGAESSQSASSSTATSSSSSSILPTVTSSGLPSAATAHSTPVGTIVGVVVASVTGIALLSIGFYYLWKKKFRVQNRPNPGGTLADEDQVEPLNAAAITSDPSSGRPGPQSAYSMRQTVIGSLLSQPRSGTQNRQGVYQPIQEEDNRTGFDEGDEREAGSSQVQNRPQPAHMPQ